MFNILYKIINIPIVFVITNVRKGLIIIIIPKKKSKNPEASKILLLFYPISLLIESKLIYAFPLLIILCLKIHSRYLIKIED